MSSVVSAPAVGWLAELELEIVRRGGRSELGRRRHLGPLRVQRPFYPEGDEHLHVYLLHPPGGIVGGDRIQIEVRVQRAASALLTTPAAQKLYRSSGAECAQNVALHVAEGAALEWLPGETIVFDGARARLATRVELEPGAAFVGWELGCLGRPASGLGFDRGYVVQAFELWRGGVPLLLDRLRIEGGTEALRAPWGHAGLPVFGNLYAVPRESSSLVDLVEVARAAAAADDETRWAVSALDELLVVRALGGSVEGVRASFARIWAALRPALIGRPSSAPRIWAT